MTLNLTALLLGTALAASSCGEVSSAASGDESDPSSAASVHREAPAPTLSLRWPEQGPPLNELFAFDLTAAGPVEVATVDADMPAHGHGMLSKPTTTITEAGGIHVEGMLFHMPGDWVVTVDCTVDGTPQHHDIPVTIDF